MSTDVLTKRRVVHDTFVIERTYPKASPAHVFKAWADPAIKRQWFGADETQWELILRESDFRVGGRDRLKGRGRQSGVVHDFRAHYIEILPGERIIYAYDMDLDDKHISASLATIEFHATAGGGTRMVLTEQGAYLDDFDNPGQRKAGTEQLMDALGRVIEQNA